MFTESLIALEPRWDRCSTKRATQRNTSQPSIVINEPAVYDNNESDALGHIGSIGSFCKSVGLGGCIILRLGQACVVFLVSQLMNKRCSACEARSL